MKLSHFMRLADGIDGIVDVVIDEKRAFTLATLAEQVTVVVQTKRRRGTLVLIIGRAYPLDLDSGGVGTKSHSRRVIR